ncbi:MAG: Kelch repeat-containing protein [Actinomycetota bacterium]
MPGAAPIPGGALVVGGENEVGNPVDSAEVYHPTTGTFSPTGSMGTVRQGPAAASLPGGRVLIAGGIGASMNFLDTAEVYDPATGTFSPTGSMSIERFKAAAAPLPDGRVLVAGGRTPDNGAFVNLATAEVFDPFTNTFSPTGSMITARWGPAAAPLPDGRVLVAGGIAADNTTVLPTAEVYDPATGTFSPTGSMGVGRRFFAAAPLPGGDVLVAGGNNAPPLSSAEVYDPSTGTFTSQGVGFMGTPREGPAAAPLADGRVLVVGGYNGSARLETAEIFTPDTFQPDALIRVRGGAPRGDDVYNEDGSGQVRSTRARPGQPRTFRITVENDGNVTDSYAVSGRGGSSRKWVVRYSFGGLNVTGAVRNGTFDFKAAAFGLGEQRDIRLVIKPKDPAKPGARKSVLVTVVSKGDGTKDAVRARVRVKKR